jgi:AraC family transcriptional regulator
MSGHAEFNCVTGRPQDPQSDHGGINLPDGHPASEQIALAINWQLSARMPAGALLLKLPAPSTSAFHRGVEVPLGQAAGKAIDNRRMSRVMVFVGKHIERNFTVADLAEVACMSPAHFARSFKTTTGLSPHEFVSRIRIALAKQMLVERHLPISDIALSVGFSSQANFSRAFRDATGMTPRGYRAISAVFE